MAKYLSGKEQRASPVAQSQESTCNAGDTGRRCGFNPWVGEIPWRKNWQPTPVFSWGSPCTEEPGGDRPWCHKKSDATKQQQTTKHTHKDYSKQSQDIDLFRHVGNKSGQHIQRLWFRRSKNEKPKFKACIRKSNNLYVCRIEKLSETKNQKYKQ